MTVSVTNSERLSFRLMDITDKSLFLDLDSDPEVMRFINGGIPTTEQEYEDIYIPRHSTFRNPEKGWGYWATFIAETNTFIGWVLVRPMNFFNEDTDLDNIELGWRFKQLAWGKGYATEAAQAILTALKEQVGYNKFTAIAVSDNTGSIKIMEKLGMNFAKKQIHQDPLGNQDAEYYELHC